MAQLTVRNDMSDQEILDFNSEVKKMLSGLPKVFYCYTFYSGPHFRDEIQEYIAAGPIGASKENAEECRLLSLVTINLTAYYPICAHYITFLRKFGFSFTHEISNEVYWSYCQEDDWIDKKIEEYKNDEMVCKLLRDHGLSYFTSEVYKSFNIPSILHHIVRINIPAMLVDRFVNLVRSEFLPSLPPPEKQQYLDDWDEYVKRKTAIVENEITDFAKIHNLDENTVKKCYHTITPKE